MELAYLGLFSKIFNWVMDKIFEPIFKWLADLLSTVFSWIFNEILSPILFPILEKVMLFTIDLFMKIYGTFIYSIFSGVLKLIDYMETAFDVFIGIEDVTYTTDKGKVITGSLVEILLQQDTVSTVFWVLTLSGILIAMILTIFGTAKSAFDLDFESKRPVSKVLTEMMKAFLQFFMVPFFVYFMLIISTDILKIASDALTGDTKTTLGRIVFVIASLNAAKKKDGYALLNADSAAASNIVLGTSPEDKYRYQFYITEPVSVNGKTISPIDYGNIKAVGEWFEYGKFDYLIGFLASIFLLFVMAICLIKFVQRIFEIVLLYIVSPYFVSTMPLDDGERFGRWRDMFIGKCFTGFGSAIGMRLYLIVCQMIMGGQIQFSQKTVGTSIEVDYFMKLFFLVGGAWAVYKSGPMITSILSAGAGGQESSTQAAIGGSLYGHTIGKAIHKGSGALQSAFRGKPGESIRNKNAMKPDPNQQFNGSKNDRMTKAQQKLNPSKTSNTGQTWKKGVVQNQKRSNIQIGAHRANAAEKSSNYIGKRNFSLGSAFQSKYDEKGNHKIRVLGFGVDRDASGNTMAFKMPVMNMKFQKANPNESMKLARMHIPGITRIDSNIQNGRLQYSDISVLHGAVRLQTDETGSKARILGGLAQYKTDMDGTHISVAGVRSHNYLDGSTGYGVGKLNVRTGKDGDSVSFGNHISIKTAGTHMESLKFGSLEYSRSGITKNVPASGGSGSAPSASTTAPKIKLGPAVPASPPPGPRVAPKPVTPASPPPSTKPTSSTKQDSKSGTKPGGK